MPLIDKAKYVASRLREIANEKGIDLQLRKKRELYFRQLGEENDSTNRHISGKREYDLADSDLGLDIFHRSPL